MSVRVKKTIGLIVLTLVVVALIFLVIYLVQKSDVEKQKAEQLKSAHIGETLDCDGFVMTLTGLDNKREEIWSLKAQEGNCFLLIEIAVDAEKEVSLKQSDFSIKDGDAVYGQIDEGELLEDSITVKAEEKKTFYLLYEVKKGRLESYYLTAYGYKIDLGGTLQGPVLSSGDAEQ